MLPSESPTKHTSYSIETLAKITAPLQQYMLPCLTASTTFNLRATCELFYQTISSAPGPCCKALSSLLPKELLQHAKTGAHLLFMLTKQQPTFRKIKSGQPGHVSHVQMPEWFGPNDPLCWSESWPSMRLAIWSGWHNDPQSSMHVVNIDAAVPNSPEPASRCTITGISDLECDWYWWIKDDEALPKPELCLPSKEADVSENKTFCAHEKPTSLGDMKSFGAEQPSVTDDHLPTFTSHRQHLLMVCYQSDEQQCLAAGEMQAIPNQLWLHIPADETRSKVLHFWMDFPTEAILEGEIPPSIPCFDPSATIWQCLHMYVTAL